MSHLAEGREVAVFALDQELSSDVSGGLHLTGLLVLLVQLLHPLLSGKHLSQAHRHTGKGGGGKWTEKRQQRKKNEKMDKQKGRGDTMTESSPFPRKYLTLVLIFILLTPNF